ncbi:MAG: hypothetical protein COV70_02910 [Parcubacteria group bacterium CG11_big_fil_rev_8_21_14_0_20_39_22]|nr:MAG: hypothetical protein COV70_02910 [Parcubacteria group bacterium CG11_big_fil_rev_8_21_14_0_20_39_22]
MNIWIFIIIIVLVILLSVRRTREPIVGICETAIGLDAKKKDRKERILAFLREKGELSNSDIREALEISERSVVRYMNELEKEGSVEQVGDTGRGVTYRLK